MHAGYVAIEGTVDVALNLDGSSSVIPLRSIHEWLIILSRVDDTFPLDHDWVTYRTGFGEISTNFWLGLEKIYQLSNGDVNGGKEYRLKFLLQSFDNGKLVDQRIFFNSPALFSRNLCRSAKK